jgi:hypothetical protein
MTSTKPVMQRSGTAPPLLFHPRCPSAVDTTAALTVATGTHTRYLNSLRILSHSLSYPHTHTHTHTRLRLCSPKRYCVVSVRWGVFMECGPDRHLLFFFLLFFTRLRHTVPRTSPPSFPSPSTPTQHGEGNLHCSLKPLPFFFFAEPTSPTPCLLACFSFLLIRCGDSSRPTS